MHARLRRLGDVVAGGLADRFDGGASLAEHDLPLALALDEDGLLDADGAVLLLHPAVGLDRGAVGQLVVQALVDFLARDLGGEEAQRGVRDLILRVKPGSGRHMRGQPVHHALGAGAGERREHEHRLEGRALGQRGADRQEPVLVLQEVDLVQDEENRLADLLDAGDQFGRLRRVMLRDVDEQPDKIGVGRPAPGGGHHGAVEPALGAEQAGRIDEHDLRRAVQGDAAHLRARGLDLARHDRDLGPDKLVQQRRLARVRRADQRHEACPGRPGRRPRLFPVIRHWRPPASTSLRDAGSSRPRSVRRYAWSALRRSRPPRLRCAPPPGRRARDRGRGG